MHDYEKIAALAKGCGFTHCVPLDVETLDFMQEVRDMCNAQKCRNYDASWSCPPACAALEEVRGRVKLYSGGVLVQTVGDIEDSCDWEGIMDAGARHKEHFARMWGELEKLYGKVLAMGAGACKLCGTCAYPSAPCRNPGRMEVSMEAHGLQVSKVCTDNGLKYNYGPGKVAFTSCYLL